MKRLLFSIILAVALIVCVSPPARAATNYDGYFTNVLVKGILNIQGAIVAYASHTFSTTADWVLSVTERLKMILVTASGSGGVNIIAPNESGRVYIVRNAGTGAVTIKISGGSGVSVGVGKTAIVWHNGSDYVRLTDDATH